MREQPNAYTTNPMFNAHHAASPEVTRTLFSTGFMFKNHNSPISCDIRLSPDFKIQPKAPQNPEKILSGRVPFAAVQERSKSKSTINYDRDYLGSIGWGVTNPNLSNKVERKVLKEQPHKWAYNHDQLRCNFFMETTGNFAERIDAYLGLPYHMLDQLSMKEQRKIVTDRCEQILHEKAQKILYNQVPLTKPIDTHTNTMRHYKKMQQQMDTTLQTIKSGSVDLNRSMATDYATTIDQTMSITERKLRNKGNSELPSIRSGNF